MEVIQITSLSMILLGSLDVDCLFDATSSGALGVNHSLKIAQIAIVLGRSNSSGGKICFVDCSADELRWELCFSFAHLSY